MNDFNYFLLVKSLLYTICVLNAKTILLSFQIKIEPGQEKLTLLDFSRT